MPKKKATGKAIKFRRRTWTEEDEQLLLQEIAAGNSYSNIAARLTAKLGRSIRPNMIGQRVSDLRGRGTKIPERQRAKPQTPPPDQGPIKRRDAWTPEEDQALLTGVADGATYGVIAKNLTAKFGRKFTREAIANRMMRMRGDDVVMPVRGAGNAAGKTSDDVLIDRLVVLTKKPQSREATCNALDISPAKLDRLVITAEAKGFRIGILGDNIGRPPSLPNEKAFDIIVSQVTSHHVVPIVGDVHFGSKHHLAPQFKEFCDQAYERARKVGPDVHFLQVGDLLDGVYHHSVWEQSQRGFEEQVSYAIAHLPKYKGAIWHFIAGNHDETFVDATGIDVGRAIVDRFRAAGRTDLVYHGARGAYVHLKQKGQRRGLFVELWHPKGSGNAYAKTYRIQKKVEHYAPGQKPDLLCVGHWHQSVYMTTRGVHALSAGCWQGNGSSFAKSLGTAPDIGSWIVEYSLTKEGTVRELSPSWRAYYETELVRDVGLG